MEQKPMYYGEIQSWAKFIKAIFSGMSIIIFLLALFSTKHDVRSFLRSLFLSSSPIFIDLLVIYSSIKDNKNNTDIYNKKSQLLYGIISSIICFVIPLVILLSYGNNIVIIDDFVDKGVAWWLCLLFFPFIIYAFYINVFRPFDRKTNPTIKTEQRPS